jgi:GTP-binding protein
LRREFAGKVRLVAAVHRPEDLPRCGGAVAFAGRSNVGKSSLINRLLGADAAAVSKTPGRTRGLYLYEGGDGRQFVDLPGYGFAAAPRTDRNNWRLLLEAYFDRVPPALVVHLVDPRVPISDFDREFHESLSSWGIPELLVATKADRMKMPERRRAERALAAEFGEALFVSARTGEGIDALKKRLTERRSGGLAAESRG